MESQRELMYTLPGDLIGKALGGAAARPSSLRRCWGERIAGRFSKIGFKVGDEVEAVVELMNDGSYSAYAVRRPSDSTIWMFPHCSRGRVAHWRHALFMIPVIFLVVELFLALCFGRARYFSESATSPKAVWVLAGLASAISLIIGIYFPIKIAWKWRPFVQIAEKIFEALGYADPKRVDLEKDHKLASKARGDIWPYFVVDPWIYRYPKKN